MDPQKLKNLRMATVLSFNVDSNLGKKVPNSINQLHCKYANTSRKERKVLLSAASTGSNKKDSNLFKINIKGLIKGNRAGQLSKRSEKSAQMKNELSFFYEDKFGTFANEEGFQKDRYGTACYEEID